MKSLLSFGFSAVTAGIVLVGCSTVNPPQNPQPEPPDVAGSTDKPITVPADYSADLGKYANQPKMCQAVTLKQVYACDTKGGELIQQGMLGCYSCLVRFDDAGETCRDASDCQGNCYATDFVDYGKAGQTGQCAPTNSPFGCRQAIVNGVAQPALCVD